MLSKTELHQLIQTTQLHINLPAAVIEKDYYVTQVINALSKIENENFRLVFAGGTCLAKAHKIVNRMSEDIDFKIQKKNPEILSRSRLIKELKNFRSLINSALDIPKINITTTKNIARNEGKYQHIELNYQHLSPVNPTLRTELLLEFTYSDIRCPTEILTINTLIEDVLNHVKLSEASKIHCISIDETAVEKWVGLTRRIIASERKYIKDDPALIRHVFDLHFMKKANKIDNNFYMAAKEIVFKDIKQYGNQHREYALDPASEILNSLDLLKNQPIMRENYLKFINDMVYDKKTAPDYDLAVSNIEQISSEVIKLL